MEPREFRNRSFCAFGFRLERFRNFQGRPHTETRVYIEATRRRRRAYPLKSGEQGVPAFGIRFELQLNPSLVRISD